MVVAIHLSRVFSDYGFFVMACLILSGPREENKLELNILLNEKHSQPFAHNELVRSVLQDEESELFLHQAFASKLNVYENYNHKERFLLQERHGISWLGGQGLRLKNS